MLRLFCFLTLVAPSFAFGGMHCFSNNDCLSFEYCNVDGGPFGSNKEGTCETDGSRSSSPWGGGQGCNTSFDCKKNEVCESRQCSEPVDGRGCSFDADCGDGARCQSGTWSRSCVTDSRPTEPADPVVKPRPRPEQPSRSPRPPRAGRPAPAAPACKRDDQCGPKESCQNKRCVFDPFRQI